MWFMPDPMVSTLLTIYSITRPNPCLRTMPFRLIKVPKYCDLLHDSRTTMIVHHVNSSRARLSGINAQSCGQASLKSIDERRIEESNIGALLFRPDVAGAFHERFSESASTLGLLESQRPIASARFGEMFVLQSSTYSSSGTSMI